MSERKYGFAEIADPDRPWCQGCNRGMTRFAVKGWYRKYRCRGCGATAKVRLAENAGGHGKRPAVVPERLQSFRRVAKGNGKSAGLDVKLKEMYDGQFPAFMKMWDAEESAYRLESEKKAERKAKQAWDGVGPCPQCGRSDETVSDEGIERVNAILAKLGVAGAD